MMMGVLKKLGFGVMLLPIFVGVSLLIQNNMVDVNATNTAVSEVNEIEVILGGESININMDASGVIITNNKGNIAAGDILYKINDQEVSNRYELNMIKETVNVADITVTYLHNNELVTTNISDEDLKNIEGINNLVGNATITYINPETLKYAAVAHSVIENVNITNSKIGTINNNHINSIIKSEGNTVGKFIATKKNEIGTIETINETGMYGTYNGNKKDDLIKIGTPKKGTAYIVTTLDNNQKAYYKINIDKVFNERNDMQIEFSINDQVLINKTNGILKGMSGSPIVQDGKLVGAVSHAVNGKANEGYGLIIDKMLINTI